MLTHMSLKVSFVSRKFEMNLNYADGAALGVLISLCKGSTYHWNRLMTDCSNFVH